MSIGIHYNTEAGDKDITSYVKDPSVFTVKEGYVDGPKGPGLGIEVDEDAVRAASKDAKPWVNVKKFYDPDGSVREW
jgi:galactonate dehydratase